MSSAFREAFVAQLTQSMDPMNGVVQSFAEKQIEVLDSQVSVTKGAAYEKLLEAKHRFASNAQLTESEIAGFNRILDRISS